MANRNRKAGIFVLLLVLTCCSGGAWWWKYSRFRVSTDDAFVDSRTFAVSSRIPGRVLEVFADDNRRVKKGDLLLVIDPSDYEVQVREAEAGLLMAKNETSGEYAQIEAAKAGVEQAKAALEQAELDLKRGQALYGKEVIARDQLDRLSTAERMAGAKLSESRGRLEREEANLGLSNNGSKEARIALREAKLAQARLNLSYTKIYATSDGFITRKNVENGNFVQPGQALMSIVDLENVWITANYKESQLSEVRAGQHVEFEVDTYPGKKFMGKVDSLMAGTGSAFALLPPENASGNFVKVVQRIPVKITIDSATHAEQILRVGMSVVPTILTGQSM